MGRPSRATQEKRNRERAKQERKEEKRAARAARKELKKSGRPGSDDEGTEDPDLIGIVPGPQPETLA